MSRGDSVLKSGIKYWEQRVHAELLDAGRRYLTDLEEWDNARSAVSVALLLVEDWPVGQRRQRGAAEGLSPLQALAMVVALANEQVLAPWGVWSDVTDGGFVAMVHERVVGLFTMERDAAVAALDLAGRWEPLAETLRPWHEAAVRDLGHPIPQDTIDNVLDAVRQGPAPGLGWARTGAADWVLYQMGGVQRERRCHRVRHRVRRGARHRGRRGTAAQRGTAGQRHRQRRILYGEKNRRES